MADADLLKLGRCAKKDLKYIPRFVSAMWRVGRYRETGQYANRLLKEDPRLYVTTILTTLFPSIKRLATAGVYSVGNTIEHGGRPAIDLQQLAGEGTARTVRDLYELGLAKSILDEQGIDPEYAFSSSGIPKQRRNPENPIFRLFHESGTRPFPHHSIDNNGICHYIEEPDTMYTEYVRKGHVTNDTVVKLSQEDVQAIPKESFPETCSEDDIIVKWITYPPRSEEHTGTGEFKNTPRQDNKIQIKYTALPSIKGDKIFVLWPPSKELYKPDTCAPYATTDSEDEAIESWTDRLMGIGIDEQCANGIAMQETTAVSLPLGVNEPLYIVRVSDELHGPFGLEFTHPGITENSTGVLQITKQK